MSNDGGGTPYAGKISMALVRLLWLLRHPRPLDAEMARKLKHLLHMQMSVFVLVLALLATSVLTRQVPHIVPYLIGFGIGWVACVRYYVFRYVA